MFQTFGTPPQSASSFQSLHARGQKLSPRLHTIATNLFAHDFVFWSHTSTVKGFKSMQSKSTLQGLPVHKRSLQ
jgi:hypothetical protein